MLLRVRKKIDNRGKRTGLVTCKLFYHSLCSSVTMVQWPKLPGYAYLTCNVVRHREKEQLLVFRFVTSMRDEKRKVESFERSLLHSINEQLNKKTNNKIKYYLYIYICVCVCVSE